MGALWTGRLPLAHAFWLHAILGVTLFNLVATFARLLVIAEDGPDLLAWTFFLLPIPYGIAAVVGVWRSSERGGNAGLVAGLARGLAITWGLAFLIV